MSNIVLKVENLSKLYRLGEVGTGTISHDLNRWWAKVRGKEDPYVMIGQENNRSVKAESDYVWSLKDVNLEVRQGDVMGIIGKNGAGKSTLLKIISQITAPTIGSIKIKGRVAALLEVGTGMNPEMTARENIYLNGAILGMKKKEIDIKFDEIVDFSGCTMYVDTPIKRFSSGMRVRLGFAVAAFLEPEILIIDEVLAVGDAEFQKKAIGKMQDVSKTEGRTVLFVSHNMVAVQNLCTKGLLMEHGMVKLNGGIHNVIEGYLNQNTTENTSGIVSLENALRSNGNCKAIQKIWIENKSGEIANSIAMGDSFSIVIEFKSKFPISNALFGFGIENSQGERITSLNNEIAGNSVPASIVEGKAILKVNQSNLMDGRYFVSVSIVSNQIVWIDYVEQAISFEIVPSDVYNSGKLIDKSQGKIYLNGSVNVI
jgi:lipopolysaccharide transport system ATP-binding protein